MLRVLIEMKTDSSSRIYNPPPQKNPHKTPTILAILHEC